MEEKITLGISSCLLGENVRYDGGHKLDHFLRDTLGQYVTYVPVCPEVEAGFGIPREAMRLVGDPENPRLVTSKTSIDHTEKMTRWAKSRVPELERENLCGFIFKKDSPSSGLVKVKVYDDKNMPQKKGRGIFARHFVEHFPLTPVEDEGRLHDPRLRENFVEQIFTLKRWRDAIAERPKVGNVVDFHSKNKLLIMSHSPKHASSMGKIVAMGKQLGAEHLYKQYGDLLIDAMRLKGTTAKHINVLQHIMGYFKNQLSPDEKQELLEIFSSFRNGNIPLIVPMTIINHYARKYEQPYLAAQTYLNPHPVELKLRTYI